MLRGETLQLQGSTIGRRLASSAYETLLVVGVLFVSFLIPQVIVSVATGVGIAGPLLLLHVFCVLAAYFGWFWSRGRQSLAMKTWRLALVRHDAAPLSVGQALLRFALAWPSWLLGGAGILWALVDRDRQFLHDRLAGTRLVRL